jgi:hypothetical protein
MKTEEQIFAMFEHLDGLAFIRAVNRYYRDHDQSHLWPIRSRFDVTERAIRRIRKYRRFYGTPSDGLEYIYALSANIAQIVNNESNW